MSLTKKFVLWIRENLLLLLIFIGVIVGFMVGLMVNETVQRSTDPTPEEIAMYISFPGELFLRMLKVLIIPLIVSSVIVSLAILDQRSAAKLGKRATAYFLVTTLLAVIVALILASILKPGVNNTSEKTNEARNGKAINAILDFIRNIVPDNIVEASFESTSTRLKKQVQKYTFVNKTAGSYLTSAKNMSALLRKELVNPWSISRNSVQIIREDGPVYKYDGLEKYNSANILGILAFSVLFGAILSVLGDEGKPLKDWFNCLFNVTMKMVDISMWFSPLGICSIIAGKLAGMHDIKESVESLGMFITIVVVASFLHSLVTLPAIYFLVLRKNPFRFLAGVTKAILTAFGTGSSSAALPIALTCLEKNLKIDRRVSQFVLPVGITVNMDGGGIYIATTAMYLAQNQNGGALDFGSVVIVCFAATLSSVAMPPISAAVPIITKTIVLQTIGIRSADITLILVVDWLLDRLTTPVNIWGNCIGSAVVEHLSRDDLSVLDVELETNHTKEARPVNCAVNAAIDIEKGDTQL